MKSNRCLSVRRLPGTIGTKKKWGSKDALRVGEQGVFPRRGKRQKGKTGAAHSVTTRSGGDRCRRIYLSLDRLSLEAPSSAFFQL
jgi:hypothetical protein